MTITINGTLAATWTGDATGAGTWGTKTGGPIISLSAWNSKTTAVKDLKVEALLS